MSRRTSYNSTMEVKRLKLSSQDASGGIVQVKTTVFTVPCRIRQLNATEISVGGKDGIVSTHRVYSSVHNIKNKDELIIDDRVYDVNSTNIGSAKRGSIETDVTARY